MDVVLPWILGVLGLLVAVLLACLIGACGIGLAWAWRRLRGAESASESSVGAPPSPGVASPKDHDRRLARMLEARSQAAAEPEARHAIELRNEEVLAAIDTLEGRDDAMSQDMAYSILRRESVPAEMWPEPDLRRVS